MKQCGATQSNAMDEAMQCNGVQRCGCNNVGATQSNAVDKAMQCATLSTALWMKQCVATLSNAVDKAVQCNGEQRCG